MVIDEAHLKFSVRSRRACVYTHYTVHSWSFDFLPNLVEEHLIFFPHRPYMAPMYILVEIV